MFDFCEKSNFWAGWHYSTAPDLPTIAGRFDQADSPVLRTGEPGGAVLRVDRPT